MTAALYVNEVALLSPEDPNAQAMLEGRRAASPA